MAALAHNLDGGKRRGRGVRAAMVGLDALSARNRSATGDDRADGGGPGRGQSATSRSAARPACCNRNSRNRPRGRVVGSARVIAPALCGGIVRGRPRCRGRIVRVAGLSADLRGLPGDNLAAGVVGGDDRAGACCHHRGARGRSRCRRDTDVVVLLGRGCGQWNRGRGCTECEHIGRSTCQRTSRTRKQRGGVGCG